MGDIKSGDAALSWPTPARVIKPSRFYKLFNLVLLVSLASALSIFLPGPWNIFRDTNVRSTSFRQSLVSQDPASEWKDDVWPLRQQTPWDISTDYPYPRKVEYDVTEGTWLRLDVHPKSGDIVFDMLGDIYCLPAAAYAQERAGAATEAVPILLGVPHDSDPHFSPDGDRMVFRSDAGLGVENIWVTKYTSCEEMNVRPASATGELLDALSVRDEEEQLLAAGHRESEERRKRRLVREGRFGAQRVTNETYRWVSDARFHPSGSKIVATKWYTSGRTLGAGEGWEYPIPTSDTHIEAGSGKRIVSRTLPLGWSSGQYGNQQVGPEQFIWHGEDTVIYSKNVLDTNGLYTYSKDVHSGIYAIFSTNLTAQQTTTLVSSFPGGATRPEISRDGRTLAFVRRVRDKEALVLKDLVTGTIHHVWHGLTYDLGVISAPMGTYPSFAFTPNDDAVIIWAAGQIYHVPLKVNAVGEKVRSHEPTPIRFRAHIEKRIAETATAKPDLLALETQDTQRVHAFTDLRTNHDGSKIVFQAAGVNYIHEVGTHKRAHPKKVPTLTDAPYYAPTFVRNADHFLLHARWSDTNFSAFELANLATETAYELTGLPLGRYASPILCECTGSKRLIAFVKTSGDYMTGDIIATAQPGLYMGEITLPSDQDESHNISIQNVRFVTDDFSWDEPTTKIKFVEKNQKLLVQQAQDAFVINLSEGKDEFGYFKQHTLATGAMSTELVTTVTDGSKKANHVAFVDFFHVYLASGVGADDAVWSKPGNATKGLARLSLDGGHDVVFSGDGKTLFWLLGPYIHSIEVSKIRDCSSQIRKDPLDFGISCTKNLLSYEELIVTHSTDIYRLKADAQVASLHAEEEAVANSDFLVIYNATILTMDGRDPKTDLLRDALMVVRGGKIVAILGVQDAAIPYGATTFDAQGGFVIPGFIDVHAHWNGFASYYPARSWELETFLAYGVTTLHNPSASNVLGFWERSRVERGQAIGPRIFQVGDIIYGAGEPGIHQDIVTMEEAYSALIRIKAEGGPASFSYKNYNLPSRASRQRLLLAARNLSMLCVPEGGMNYDWDQTYIVDGMTTIEHPLPIPQLYDDVITLFALSGTGSTPTHIVNYGGAWGEQYVWATEDIPNDPKLRRFTRHDVLEALSESIARPKNSYALFNTSESTAKMVRKGLKAHIGAHGEPPLGVNYHAEMFFTKQGGLTNYEVLRAATSDAAKTLGIYDSLGSLTPGKLADFLIYPPGIDLLNGNIKGTRDLKYVVRGGRVWDASTMTEGWPVEGRKEPVPPLNPE
ncbi:hypothetical protein EIP91_002623 [Steccherinum ochraceum]|uniref:Amidohydrolase-related domain-containing protein n=1 Tax=Steccherinum ochraceum TaxID=92696 RepID=A0A4R0RTA5_9APHY|nr:hypothetical protein EIP91_002623 [Steccherinum ochraceum]